MNEKKSFKFSKFVLIFVLFWIVVINVVCISLWNYLKIYEQSTPVYAGKQVLELYKNGKFKEAMEFCSVAEDGMFDVTAYQKYVESALGNDYENVKIYEGISDENDNRILEILGKSNNSLRFYLTENVDSLSFGLSSYSIKQCPIQTLTYSFTFPEDFPITINSKSVDSFEFQRDVVESFDVFETTDSVPFTKTITLDGFIEEPIIEVKGLESDLYSVVLDNGQYIVTVKPNAQQQKIVEERAIEGGLTYARYMFCDGTYKKLGEYTITESSSYQHLKLYDRMWVPKHSKYEISNIQATNFIQYSEDSYSADLSFDYFIKGKVDRTYPTKYRIFLMNVNGELKMASVEML